MGRFARSWELGKQSWRVLKGDKQLVLFPLISAVSCLLVLASFAVPIALTVDWSALADRKHASANAAAHNPLYYAVLFAFYFVNYGVIAFFNAGLIACAMRRFDGEEASVGTGLRIAASKLPQIVGWALVSSTVGMVLRMIAERSGLVGKIVVGLLGFAWTIATYFVVPVLVVEGVGPIAAVKRSAGIIRKTWGETLVTNVGLGAVSSVGTLVAFIPLAVGGAISIATETWGPAAVGGALMIVMLITLALITSTLQMILVAALYRFAATGLVPEAFNGELLRQAFRNKKEKK